MPPSRRTRVERTIRAPPRAVYGAFLDKEALARWLPPGNMRGTVHDLEPHEGGRLRMSLTYDDPTEGRRGKTTSDTDTFSGRITSLHADRLVKWTVDFESDDPRMAGPMDVTWELEPVQGGTRVVVTCDPVPPGIRLEDNGSGSAASLSKLANLLE